MLRNRFEAEAYKVEQGEKKYKHIQAWPNTYPEGVRE